METNKTDKMLKNFFNENKREITDNGFSQRVIRKLPERADRSWIVWIFGAIGTAVTLYFALNSGLINHAFIALDKVPYYYLLAGIFSFPLLGIAGYFVSQNKNYRLI